MEKSTLCAPNRVPRAEVMAVPAPAFTKTWHPFSHGDCLKALDAAVTELNLKVESEQFSLTKSGTRMFGIMEIGNGTNEEMNMAIGFRNGTDKHFAWSITTGGSVFVCTNLILSGTYRMFRMHTGGLTYTELVIGTTKMVKKVVDDFGDYRGWLDSLKKLELYDNQAAVITIAAMRKGLIPPSKYQSFHELYYDRNTKYTQTMHGWHGAVTELMKSDSLLTISDKNTHLNRFIKYETPHYLWPNTHFDFQDISKQGYAHYLLDQKREAEATKEVGTKLKAEAKKEANLKDKADAEKLTKAILRTESQTAARQAKKGLETGVSDDSQPTSPPKDLKVQAGVEKRGKSITQCPFCKSIAEVKKRTRKKVKEKYCSACGEVLG